MLPLLSHDIGRSNMLTRVPEHKSKTLKVSDYSRTGVGVMHLRLDRKVRIWSSADHSLHHHRPYGAFPVSLAAPHAGARCIPAISRPASPKSSSRQRQTNRGRHRPVPPHPSCRTAGLASGISTSILLAAAYARRMSFSDQAPTGSPPARIFAPQSTDRNRDRPANRTERLLRPPGAGWRC